MANAVLDGVDGILLGAETLRGKYPVETIKTVSSICRCEDYWGGGVEKVWMTRGVLCQDHQDRLLHLQVWGFSLNDAEVWIQCTHPPHGPLPLPLLLPPRTGLPSPYSTTPPTTST